MENPPLDLTLRIDSFPLTDVGRKRSNNEDWVAGFEPEDPQEIKYSGYLYIVADGVGGADKGERASQYAAQKVLYEYYQNPNLAPEERLEQLIRSAGNEIYQYSIDNGTPRMATTFVAGVIRGDLLTVANVGDSRAYLIRNGQIKQITVDHNLANELVRNGSMTAEEAKQSKTRNKLMRSLGGERNVSVDLFENIKLYPEDLIIFCTDGLTRYISTEEDLLRMTTEGTSEEIANRLVDFANRAGGADNISLYIIAVKAAGMRAAKTPFILAPGPVDLDTLQTQAGIPRSKKKVTKKSILGRMGILYTLIGLIALVIITGSFVIASMANARETPVLNNAELATPTIIPQEMKTATLRSVEPKLADVGSDGPTSTVISEQTAVQTQSGSALDASPQTVTETPQLIVQKACVHEVIAGEYISKIFPLFGLSVSAGSQYYSHQQCDLSGMKCQGTPVKLIDPNQINPGQVLLIPGVSTETCESVPNSYWVTVNP